MFPLLHGLWLPSGFQFYLVLLLLSQIYILIFTDSANSSPAKDSVLLARSFCYHRLCSRKLHSFSGTGYSWAASSHILTPFFKITLWKRKHKHSEGKPHNRLFHFFCRHSIYQCLLFFFFLKISLYFGSVEKKSRELSENCQFPTPLCMERLFTGRVLHQKVDDSRIDAYHDMQLDWAILGHFVHSGTNDHDKLNYYDIIIDRGHYLAICFWDAKLFGYIDTI